MTKQRIKGPALLGAIVITLAGVSAGAAARTYLDEVHDDFKNGHAADGVVLLKKQADLGDPKAQYGLGILYEKGVPEANLAKDDAQAAASYKAAAEKGYAPAQNNLG